MNAPNKTKVFAWRAYKEGLPCLLNLQKKQIQIDSRCIFCKSSTEDLVHAIFLCSDVNPWWSHFLPLLANLVPINYFSNLALWVKTNGKAEELERFCVIDASIWGRRNRRIFEGSMKSPQNIP